MNREWTALSSEHRQGPQCDGPGTIRRVGYKGQATSEFLVGKLYGPIRELEAQQVAASGYVEVLLMDS